jgi:O-antigen/teichoic acid export membrane protein
MFLGVSNNLVAGIYIEKQTKKLPLITFIGAGVNVVANFLLIPPMGIMGAAVATLLSYAAMAVVLYFVVQKIYRIEYEFERIVKIAICGSAVFLLYLLIKPEAYQLFWKSALLMLFVGLMYVMKFFNQAEISGLSRLFSKRFPQSSVRDIPPPPEV